MGGFYEWMDRRMSGLAEFLAHSKDSVMLAIIFVVIRAVMTSQISVQFLKDLPFWLSAIGSVWDSHHILVQCSYTG